MRAVAILAGLLLLTGCSAAERACTMIAALHGVSVVVAKDIAADVTGLTLTVCQDGRCTDHPVELGPGSTSVDQGCTGTKPDDACSATAVPDGTQVGFVEVDLHEGAVTVRGTLRRGGSSTALAERPATAVLVYPNGPDCGGEAAQVKLTVDAAGLH